MLRQDQIQRVEQIKELHGRLVLMSDKTPQESKMLLAIHDLTGFITSLVASSDEDYKRGYTAGYAAKRKASDKPEPPTEGGDNAEAQPLD